MEDNYEEDGYEIKRGGTRRGRQPDGEQHSQEGFAPRLGGRPQRMDQKQLQLAKQLYFRERMSLREVADALHVSHMTVWRVLARVPAAEIVGAEWMKAGASM